MDMFLFFLGVNLGMELLGHTETMPTFLKNCQTFPKRLHHFAFLPSISEISSFPHPCCHLVSGFLILALLEGVK